MALNGNGSDHIGDGGLDSDLLRTLVAVAAAGSFTRAAQTVLRTPSAVSMQMKRLEEIVGRPIFAKDGRSVAFTADGEALLGYARRILRLQEEAMSRFRARDVEGVVRLGTPDDYATRFLPPVLARFAVTHPLVQVDVACQPSRELFARLAANDIDVALVTVGCCGEPAGGTTIHREPLVWAGLSHGRAHERRPLPLAVSGSSCAWRMTALEQLDSAGVPYRIAYTSEHYVGQLAAVLADLAVAPLPASVLACGLARIDERHLPPIGFYEIEMRTAPRAAGPAIAALVEHIVASFADGGGGATDRDIWASQPETDSGREEAPSASTGRAVNETRRRNGAWRSAAR